MTAPVLDKRAHFAAIKAAIAARNAQLGTDTYNLGEVPGVDGNEGNTPRIFALLRVQRRYLESLHSTRHSTRSSWRIVVHHVGRTVDEALWADQHISAALDAAVLDVEGFSSTPVQHEETRDVAADEGLFSGLSMWIYTL